MIGALRTARGLRPGVTLLLLLLVLVLGAGATEAAQRAPLAPAGPQKLPYVLPPLPENQRVLGAGPEGAIATYQDDDTYTAYLSGRSTDVEFDLLVGRYYGDVQDIQPGKGGRIQPAYRDVTVSPVARLVVVAFNHQAHGDFVLASFLGLSDHHFFLYPDYGMQTTVYEIPTVDIFLPPNKGTDTTPPQPSRNRIRLTHDPNGSRTDIIYVKLELPGMRPLVLHPGFYFSDGSGGNNPSDHHAIWDWWSYFKPSIWQDPFPFDKFTFRVKNDFHASMYDGGAQVAREIARARNIFGVSKFHFVGHSTGAVWGREFALNHDPDHSIDKLIMYAGPNGGSFWADAAGAAVTGCWAFFLANPFNIATYSSCITLQGLYNNRSPALSQLGAGYMNWYNLTHGDPPCTQDYDYAGEFTYNHFGWLHRSGHDWVVNTWSAQTLDYGIHLDPYVDDCRWCFAHIREVEEPPYYERIKFLFRWDSAKYQPGSSGCYSQRLLATTAGGADPRPAESQFPPIVSLVEPGQTQTYPVVVDDADRAIFMVGWAGNPTQTLSLTLRDPRGATITPESDLDGIAYGLTPDGAAYHVEDPRPGTWQVVVAAEDVPDEGLAYYFGGPLTGGTNLNAGLSAPAAPVGQSVILSATLTDPAPVAGAVVSASLALLPAGEYTATVRLTHQGNGAYRASFTPQQPGVYSVMFSAAGANNAGHAFQRVQMLQLQVSQGAGLTGAYREVAQGSLGKYHTLSILAGVDLSQAATYRWSARLTTQDGRELDRFSREWYYAANPGELELHFDGLSIGNDGADGPYQVRDLLLTQVLPGSDHATSQEVAVAFLPLAYTTQAYSRYDWPRAAGIIQTGPATEQGIDSNGNTLYDKLQVSIPLDVDSTGLYRATINLAGPTGATVISTTINELNFVRGANTMVVEFDGRKIRESGVNGPYDVLDLSIWIGSGGTSSHNYGASVLYDTRPYLAADFEGGTCPVTFADVQPSEYFHQPVQYMACRNVISGYADGTFRPYNDTTRGQLAKIVVAAAGWSIDTNGGPHFSDVATHNPFYGFIETAYNRGIISGYADGTFKWGNNVTRGQLSKIIVLAKGWSGVRAGEGEPTFSDVPWTNPFYGFVEAAYSKGIISGYADGTFRIGNNATRGQIAKIVHGAVIAAP